MKTNKNTNYGSETIVKEHKKMYKAGKQWLVAGITAFSVSALTLVAAGQSDGILEKTGGAGVKASADEITDANQKAVQETVNQTAGDSTAVISASIESISSVSQDLASTDSTSDAQSDSSTSQSETSYISLPENSEINSQASATENSVDAVVKQNNEFQLAIEKLPSDYQLSLEGNVLTVDVPAGVVPELSDFSDLLVWAQKYDYVFNVTAKLAASTNVTDLYNQAVSDQQTAQTAI
ncbi:MAG: KxYKxGKxW signal peptide domain-containing protein, partial [Lactobacillaceae bacterium]|nr:KxYKxGKxW signal peptide domain-containing protein [Lactobacillaceae bacterium]